MFAHNDNIHLNLIYTASVQLTTLCKMRRGMYYLCGTILLMTPHNGLSSNLVLMYYND